MSTDFYLERGPDGTLHRMTRPDPKPRKRIVVGSAAWKELHADCYGPCLICGDRWIVELHHVVPRAVGGDDCRANLVPLCRKHHAAVTEWKGGTRTDLRHRLSDETLAYVISRRGEEWLNRHYPWSGT